LSLSTARSFTNFGHVPDAVSLPLPSSALTGPRSSAVWHVFVVGAGGVTGTAAVGAGGGGVAAGADGSGLVFAVVGDFMALLSPPDLSSGSWVSIAAGAGAVQATMTLAAMSADKERYIPTLPCM
jgi:hypothetical protein